MDNFVAYVRVSTQKQQRSGLGMEAQRARIGEFVGSQGEILKWFTECESGRKSERPELEKALTECELTGGTLLIATLSRLTRDVLFLETVKRRCDSGGFKFLCCDMPEASAFVIGIMAQVASYEIELVSQRTRAALQSAKNRGVKLGNPKGVAAFRGRQDLGRLRAGEVAKEKANEWAQKRKPIIEELVAAGYSNKAMARELTTRKLTTRRGGKWTATGVQRLRNRLESLAVPLYALVDNG